METADIIRSCNHKSSDLALTYFHEGFLFAPDAPIPEGMQVQSGHTALNPHCTVAVGPSAYSLPLTQPPAPLVHPVEPAGHMHLSSPPRVKVEAKAKRKGGGDIKYLMCVLNRLECVRVRFLIKVWRAMCFVSLLFAVKR